jgi:hypothetical protein
MPEQGALDHVAAQCWNGAVNAAGKDSIYVKGSRQGKERFSVAKDRLVWTAGHGYLCFYLHRKKYLR